MPLNHPSFPERRQSTRYQIKQSLDIVLIDGKSLTVLTRNISSSGLQIICDTWITDEIEPRGIQSYGVNHLRFKVMMQLKTNNDESQLNASCRIISAQRLSQKEYMLNLVFVDFENGSEHILDNFLEQYEQKKILVNAVA